jgi:dipeptidyl aminopeptidase/acylaminoacyl peptidase
VPLGIDNKKVLVQIYFPKSYTGRGDRVLVALHGYAGAMADYEENTNLAWLAEERGFVVVCPNMGRTLYESRYYPETEIRWSPVPGSEFLGALLIPFVRKNYGVAEDRSRTGIMGISTGGRGALLAACLYPEIFGAAAGISGDYDPPSMPNDRLLRTVYGPYDRFKDRWDGDDNVLKLAVNLKRTPVLLVHGSKDYVTPREQSLVMAMTMKQLQKKSGGYECVYLEKKHQTRDWRLWKMVLPEVMDFFHERLGK